MPKYSRIVHLGSTQGLHARPARMLAEAAAASGRAVTIALEDHDPVDAENILSLMSLTLAKGDNVTISVTAENRNSGISILGEVAAIFAMDQDASTGPAPTSATCFLRSSCESHPTTANHLTRSG